MTKTFQEITEAIDATNLSPYVKDAFGFLVEAFATDEIYDTEVDAVEAMTDQLHNDKTNIIEVIKAVTNLQTWVVIARIDGPETIILSQQIQAANKFEAEEKLLTYLQERNPDNDEFKLEFTYGPF